MTGKEDLKKTTIPPPPAGPTSGSNWRGLSRDEYPAGVARRIEESSEQCCQLSVTASKSKFPSRSDCLTTHACPLESAHSRRPLVNPVPEEEYETMAATREADPKTTLMRRRKMEEEKSL